MVQTLVRSSDLYQLHVPQLRALLGTRAFHVAMPTWNEIPLEIRSAKTQINF